MEKQPGSDRKKYSSKYQIQQERYWSNLRAELEKYRQTCGATVNELADGLEISRQRLYDFLNDSSVGLPINWANLMGLWDCLTQPESKIKKKLKPEHQENRDRLKREGPKHLLLVSGYLPQSPQSDRAKNVFQISPVEIENPQVYRVISSLNSSWIPNDIVRTYLANQVLDLIIEHGKLHHQSHKVTFSDREFIEKWPENTQIGSQESEALEKYRREIRKLFDSGKQEFVVAELFELYKSIHDHEVLNIHIPNHIYIIDCQFRILSNSIRNAREETKQEFAKSEQKLIDFLRGISQKQELNHSSIDSFLTSNPVIEVAIKCNFSYNNKNYPSIIWRYSSNAPHIRNMFIAIKNGLGYPFQLAGLFTRSMGRLERSLIRSEVILSDPEQENKVYQGWWVDSNTILGILRAAVDAVKRWLADQNVDISRYYESFQRLAEIDEKLFISRASFYSHVPGLNYAIAEDCVKEIQKIKQHCSNAEREDKYFRQHINSLTRKSRTAQLTQMHIALLEGNVQEATRFFDLARKILLERDILLENASQDTDSKENGILILNASSCLMFHYLLVGKQSFLKDKEWRNQQAFSVESNLRRLGGYIWINGCIDIDAYLYASQFLGTVSYIEFYTAQNSDDISYLEAAVNHLLSAAHYAYRIGHMKRALHWLAYASRICCRLGDLERAQYYSKLAQQESVVSTSLNRLGDVEPLMTYSEFADKVSAHLNLHQEERGEFAGNSWDWSMSNIYLSKGEINFFEGHYEKALEAFVKSLEISVYTGFSRLAADSIYNTYRVSIQLDAEQIRKALTERKSPSKIWNRNEFTRKLSKFITELASTKTHDVPAQLHGFSKEIWDDWANVKGDTERRIHPFNKSIEEGTFLDNFRRDSP